MAEIPIKNEKVNAVNGLYITPNQSNIPYTAEPLVEDDKNPRFPYYGVGTTLLIVNIFLPGVGSMISGCIIGQNVGKSYILEGVFQLLTAPCIIGWIWSIFSSLDMIKMAGEPVPASTRDIEEIRKKNAILNM